MRRKIKSAFLACVLAATMLVGTAPSIAYAEEATEETGTEVVAESEEASEAQTEAQAEDQDAEEELATNDGLGMTSLVTYGGHVQTYGNMDPVYDGAYFGTTGEAKRLEAISVKKGDAVDLSGDIVYRAHVQTYGTTSWKKNGAYVGTEGEGKRLEAVQMYLTGELAENYDIYYCLHVQTYGWSKWVKGSSEDSGWCGTSGLAKRVEAIRVQLVAKGMDAPTDMDEVKVQYTYLTPNSSFGSIMYYGHQQTYGDIGPVTDGGLLGTIGQSKRLEALFVCFEPSICEGSVKYKAHVQTYGWQDWVKDGEMAGTRGQSKRVEALQIQLDGDVANFCDIYYRVHVQSYGWMGWAKNGEPAGSSGLAKRIEAIEIRMVPKGGLAPEANLDPYVTYVP